MWFSCFSCLSSYLCGSSFFFFFPFYLVLSTFLLLQNEIGWKWTNIHIFEWPYLVNLYILLHHSVKIDRFHYYSFRCFANYDFHFKCPFVWCLPGCRPQDARFRFSLSEEMVSYWFRPLSEQHNVGKFFHVSKILLLL